jgi:hypothetical protein
MKFIYSSVYSFNVIFMITSKISSLQQPILSRRQQLDNIAILTSNENIFPLDWGTKSGSDILTGIPRNTVVKLLIHGETTVTTDLLLEPSYAQMMEVFMPKQHRIDGSCPNQEIEHCIMHYTSLQRC